MAINYKIDSYPSRVDEGGVIEFRISRSGDTILKSEITLKTRSDSAREGSDYESLNQTIQFGAYETSKTVKIKTFVDADQAESKESFYLNAYAANSLVASGRGDIENLSNKYQGSLSKSSYLEGEKAVITITRDGNTAAKSTIEVRTRDGSADSNDYTGLSQKIDFLPNQKSVKFEIEIKKDTVYERDEQFRISYRDIQTNNGDEMFINIRDNSGYRSDSRHIEDVEKIDIIGTLKTLPEMYESH